MKREIFGNLEELTRPDVLSELVQERISTVCLEPFATSGHATPDSLFLTSSVVAPPVPVVDVVAPCRRRIPRPGAG